MRGGQDHFRASWQRSRSEHASDGCSPSARRGAAGCLVIRGEAGIGKTALLEDAARSARGMAVLRARGVESEAELPYAGLLTLTRPILALVGELPEHQAAALRAALALGQPKPPEPLAVCAATLGLLAAAAERDPLLVLVDDATGWIARPLRRSASRRGGCLTSASPC